MQQVEFHFQYEQYADNEELPVEDARLLQLARLHTDLAYAPYSQFQVAAIAELSDGTIVTATNQENASYPAGLCAERVLLGTVASQYPGQLVKRIALSYRNLKGQNSSPISPCGICRQSLLEFQERTMAPIRLIMGAQEGRILVVQDCKFLLPFAFTRHMLLNSPES